MDSTVDFTFPINTQLKSELDSICEHMGITLSVALTIFCLKMAHEKDIPFEITDNEDPFYFESNLKELERRVKELRINLSQLGKVGLGKDS